MDRSISMAGNLLYSTSSISCSGNKMLRLLVSTMKPFDIWMVYSARSVRVS